MGTAILFIVGIYFGIGCVFGIVVTVLTIVSIYRRGFNEVSKAMFDMEYGGEGTTFISMFFFPFCYMLMCWPLVFLQGSHGSDD